jgi:CO/xanthine dehydrogenase Mo-binding subunit
MENISASVKKKDHDGKIAGTALYVDDHDISGMLHGKLLRSTKAKARIRDIVVPALPDGYIIVDRRDIPGVNQVHIVQDDTPVFAGETVEYVGDPILLVAGPGLKTVERLLNEITVVYEELTPVLDMRASDVVFFNYNYAKGDIDTAFKEADRVFEETFETGYQEQAYLEPQGIIAWPDEDGIAVRGSIQCPYYVHTAVSKALGLDCGKVRVIQDVTGGGFGGKEDYPSILACQAAVAAKKANKPVKVIFDRREDMGSTSKRHPSVSTYKVAVKNGWVTGMDIDVTYNSGAYTTLTPVVLQRGLICASGVYTVPNLRVRGKAVKTNTVPCGAFRGFGAPQTFFAVEMMMNHVAEKLGADSLEFKERHLAKEGDATSTSGIYHFHVPLPEMLEKIDKMSGYREKRRQYKHQTGRYRKGVGLSLFYHGCGFTGSGERDLIKAVVRLRKNADGTVTILAANSDIGQGVKTTFSKIVADTLGIPLDSVICDNPDTAVVPDSGPTVASRSIMTVGELLYRAAVKLKKDWKPGEEQMVEEHFVEPDFLIPFHIEDFKGDAYPTYSWGVNVVEAELDTLTAETKILGAWGVFDVGVPIDTNIMRGQLEGGMLQGLGYASMEQTDCDDKGVLRNKSFSDYIIPTSVDVPNLKTDLVLNPYSDGPYGAKGAGELPLVGAAPAYAGAVEQALGRSVVKIPLTQEDTMKVIQGVYDK